MNYWQGHLDCEMKRIRKELRKHGLDPDKLVGNLDEMLKLCKKLKEIGIIEKKLSTNFYPELINPYNQSQQLYFYSLNP